jgi:3-oxoacyl-[acyl-carrier protein] reductase
MTKIDLTGKTAVVTGAGQGLGRATAAALYDAGANVVVNYYEDDAGVNFRRAEETVTALGERALPLAADVRDREALREMFDAAADHFGGLDLVVCNAGVLRDRTVKKMTRQEWQQVIDTNLTGVFNTCQAAAERLRAGGRIVNMASVAGAICFFGQTNYSADKAGVNALTKVLSKDLSRGQINFNAVSPGVELT